jgi:iron complex outermembrane receptor protein
MEIAAVRPSAIGLLALACSLPASAQSSPPQTPARSGFRQDVVVTAAAVPVEIGSVTRTLTVITRDEIARLPVQSVADVLRLVSTVDVRARGERGVQTDFAVRGANFGQMLVLVDGVRLNDAQSGHHNGDIPIPLDAVERIEVLHGPGSSLFGADAFGGTINVITRDDGDSASGMVQTGSFGLVGGRGQVSTTSGPLRQLFAASVERSSGFMFERGFSTAGVTSRTAIGQDTRVLASYLWKDFGANGFYGNAPSHEWTNQTLVAADRGFGSWGNWQATGTASYRTHGDRFLFDVRRPGVAENRHRTHAAIGSLRLSRVIAGRASFAAGAELSADWIRSSNLGDHTTRRVSAFAEWRQAAGTTVQFDTSVRVDRYTEFGSAVSPSIGAAWWPTSGLRVRASTGRAFRAPTFTERYYSDPANWARPEVGAETSWGAESGIDLFMSDDWHASGTVFGRLDDGVIDWLRADTSERWRTYNVRDVDTTGVELTLKRTLPGGAFAQAGYTFLDVTAAAVTQLSKYVLDYAPHGLVVAGSVPLLARVQFAPRVEYRHRTRSTGKSEYVLLDLRLSRSVGRYDIRVEGTNLGDASYQEVAGVAMPGRAVSIALAVGR